MLVRLKEHKVGDKQCILWDQQFVYLQVTEVQSGDCQRKCNNCFYHGKFLTTGCEAPPCMDYERSDRKNVIYKEVKE